MLIDTHCHLTDPAFDLDRGAVVARLRAAGVDRVLTIESKLANIGPTLEWTAGEVNFAVATACHPHDAAAWHPEYRDRLRDVWRHPLVRAAGEMGLDYHYDYAPRPAQREVFAEQLALAVEAALPVVIHAREADDDVVAILTNEPRATIVLHSFSSGPALRGAGLEHGWYFSFSGMVTFKSWTQDDAVRAVPSDRLLLETDAPYLAPVPHRGKRNEPAFVVEVAEKIARSRNTSVQVIADQTSLNAKRLFWPESTR